MQTDFLSTLLTSMNKAAVRYFILRNYEGLPESNSGKDIDIVIEPGSYHIVQNLLINNMRSYDVHYYQVTQFDRMRCWYIMDNRKIFGIHIDIIENELYKGFEFFDFDSLYENVMPYKFFYVLNPQMDTVMLLVQNIVAYKHLKDKYRDTIHINYQKCKSEIDELIRDFWGPELGSLMIKHLTSSDFNAIVEDAKIFEKGAMRRIFLKRPFYTSKNIGRFLLGKVYRILVCPKKFWRFMAVEAPDGTGKTTFINALVLELRKYYVSDEGRFCIHHFRPSLLPNLGAVGEKTGVMKQDIDFTNPHRAKPANLFSSFIRMTYYWLDYLMGIPFLLRKEVQYEKYTIFDRYIYDFLVDPERSRINLPKWIRMLYAKMVIRPQIVFVLQAEAEVIYKRKQELTKEEISRQLNEFGKLNDIGGNVVFVNANSDVQTMVQQAIHEIFSRFLNRVD